MKPMFSEKYYRDQYDKFIKEIPGEHYANPEADLAYYMEPYETDGYFREHSFVLNTVRQAMAKRIASSLLALVKKEHEALRLLEAGKASLGYTAEIQEASERSKLRQRFEFNCLLLSDFKKAYGLEGIR